MRIVLGANGGRSTFWVWEVVSGAIAVPDVTRGRASDSAGGPGSTEGTELRFAVGEQGMGDMVVCLSVPQFTTANPTRVQSGTPNRRQRMKRLRMPPADRVEVGLDLSPGNRRSPGRNLPTMRADYLDVHVDPSIDAVTSVSEWRPWCMEAAGIGARRCGDPGVACH